MTPRMTDHFKRIGTGFQGLVTFETELMKGPLGRVANVVEIGEQRAPSM